MWRARDPLAQGQDKALKLVPLQTSRPEHSERVRREARALSQLDHPCLVPCTALFEDLKLGVVGMVMDLVAGTSLKRAMAEDQLNEAHKHSVLSQLATVLGYLHPIGIVHRDIKPENIMLTPSFWKGWDKPGTMKLVDLGIARVLDSDRLTADGGVVGTVPYMAPEVLDPASFAGDSAHPQVDIFAFGVVGWLLLTGQHPTGLGADATLFDFAQAYRQAASAPGDFPLGEIGGPWSRRLRAALRLDARNRPPNGLALTEEMPTRNNSGPPKIEPAKSSTAAFAPTVDIRPDAPPSAKTSATMVSPAPSTPEPTTKMSTSWRARGAVVGALLLTTAGAVYWAERGKPVGETHLNTTQSTSSSAPWSSKPPSSAASSEEPRSPTRPTSCKPSESLCDCCPSGRDCGPRGCETPLEVDEDWHLRVGKVELKDGKDLATTHASARVCLKVSRDEKWNCRGLNVTQKDQPPLYATTPDLIAHGIDVRIDAPIGQGVNSDLAWKLETVFKQGLTRETLCKGLVIEKLDTHIPVQRVTLWLTPASEAPIKACSVTSP